MPKPEPTLAEICKTVREMEARAVASMHPDHVSRPWNPGDLTCDDDTDGPITAYCVAVVNHALALVQAAEQGEKACAVADAAAKYEALRQRTRAGTFDGSYEIQIAKEEDAHRELKNALYLRLTKLPHEEAAKRCVPPASQALSSGAPTSIRVTLGGTTNQNEAARGGSST